MGILSLFRIRVPKGTSVEITAKEAGRAKPPLPATEPAPAAPVPVEATETEKRKLSPFDQSILDLVSAVGFPVNLARLREAYANAYADLRALNPGDPRLSGEEIDYRPLAKALQRLVAAEYLVRTDLDLEDKLKRVVYDLPARQAA